MRKVVLLEHVSLDGFVAGPHGEMDWIQVGDDALWDYVTALTADADAAIYGRVTYQMMESYWPTAADNPGATKHDLDHARWVNAATKLVFSRTLTSVSWQNTRLISDGIAEVIEAEKRQPGKNLLLIGSPGLAQSFMALGLIDEFRLNVNPVALGEGLPLFARRPERIGLTLAGVTTFASGVVGLCYEKA
jgi:dihydrofolate reductase